MDYTIYSKENIEFGARQQMEVGSKLPIAVAADLMPDPHHGHGFPLAEYWQQKMW